MDDEYRKMRYREVKKHRKNKLERGIYKNEIC